MNFLDIIFLIPLLFGAVIGFRRGVVKEILALVAVVMAVYVARYFSPVLSGFLINHLSISRGTAYPLGYILVLVIFGGGMYFLAEMLTRLLKAMKLGTLNHIFG
ncbi:MAG: CvpA family protein, partial [Paludibacteraceae bacterium]|nr:CvpA family protein [Paludibacteraceae bacterium]